MTQRILWRGPWKLVFNGFDYDELYNLEDDPHELHNLGQDPAHEEVRRELMAEIWRIARETGDRAMEGSALSNLGNARYSLHLVPEAIEAYRGALDIAREAGDRPGEGAVLGNLGVAYHALRRTEEAVAAYEPGPRARIEHKS